MASPRDIRKAALQALYQFDIRGEQDLDEVAQTLDEDLSDNDRRKAMELATAAFAGRREADLAVKVHAPTWPAHRQPAIDRAIMRLAHFEMISGRVNPKIAVNEAVELAKLFSTERSPSFVNAVLDKILRKVLAAKGEPVPETPEIELPAIPPVEPGVGPMET